jgi:hypothetical protein
MFPKETLIKHVINHEFYFSAQFKIFKILIFFFFFELETFFPGCDS